MQQQLALLSSNVVIPGSEFPKSGALLISDGKILDFVPKESISPDVYQSYQVEDLGDLYISPGLVDLNVSFNSESASEVSKSAISGGVTTIATADPIIDSDLYTDVAPLHKLSDSSLPDLPTSVWGFKARISPEPSAGSLSRIDEALALTGDSLIIVHPEYAFPIEETKPEPLQILSEIESESDSDSEEASPEKGGAFRRSSVRSNVDIKPVYGQQTTCWWSVH